MGLHYNKKISMASQECMDPKECSKSCIMNDFDVLTTQTPIASVAVAPDPFLKIFLPAFRENSGSAPVALCVIYHQSWITAKNYHSKFLKIENHKTVCSYASENSSYGLRFYISLIK